MRYLSPSPHRSHRSLGRSGVVGVGARTDPGVSRPRHHADTYVGRSPHEAFFTPDGKEVWVTVRGEDFVAVLDGQSFEENGEGPLEPLSAFMTNPAARPLSTQPERSARSRAARTRSSAAIW